MSAAAARLLWLVAAALLWPTIAAAHLTPNSEIGLSIGRTAIRADIVIPLGELRYAEPALAAAPPEALGRWLLGHIGARGPDGRGWSARLVSARTGGSPVPDLEATILLAPPPGAPVRHLTLRYDAVLGRVPSHFALVWLKDDYDGGRLGHRPELLAGLRQGNAETVIDRGAPSGWRGFGAAVGLGIKHIAEGHDHLLFLLGLLLPAPLLAAHGRWAGYAGARHTLRSLALIVTAFTIGHSLTLIGGALFGWQLPAQPVEALIALSILITAVHGWRPIFAGREPLVAAGFGLVHGLAFATIIGHFSLDPGSRALAILGFNLGIELVQLALVALVAPPLALLARAGRYDALRIGGAIVIAIAALLWLAERLSDTEIAAARFVDDALGRAPWLLPLLLVSSFYAWRTSGSRPRPNRR
ncbi:HupE/UreJ family protein [Rhizorhabdus dicambivorans]|uniref:HupE/UreJ family protein n=1 Tax=Rhizorhabdus dicambivorans TaxID=1850238 RepID=UPI0008350DDE|nr:HupE/UreJ family protein [Rhizorhabdus dicambivorans]